MKLLLRAGLFALALLGLSLQNNVALAPESGILAEAASRGDMSEVRALLGMGVNPDEPHENGQTALGFATLLGHVELIEILCEAGANPNLVDSEGLNPLMMAVRAYRHDLVVILLRYGANVNFVSDLIENGGTPVSALSLAINLRYYDLARLLILEGAKASRLSSLNSKAPNPLNLPGVEIELDYRIWLNLFFLRDFANSPDWDAKAVVGDDRWVLHRAARNHDFELLERGIRAGGAPSAVDARGVSPLMVAAWHGNRSAVTLLLRRGANPSERDEMGRDALCYAAAGGDVIVVRRLLDALGKNVVDAGGGEPDARFPAILPESFAAELELLEEQDAFEPRRTTAPVTESETVERSLEDEEIAPAPVTPEEGRNSQKDVNESGVFESSPLYYSLAAGNRLVLDLLLDAKFANPIEDEEGVDPLMIAAWLSDLYAVKKLASHYPSRRSDLAGRTALAWSAAAFVRDRAIARGSGYSKLPARNYPIARFFCSRQRSPGVYTPEPTTEIHHSVIEAWNPGISFDDADYWRRLEPSPAPPIPGDGDRTLYQIFRDEEHDIPSEN